MKLIKLHYRRATVNEKRGGIVYINADHIVSISEFGEGSCVQTVTDIDDGKGYYVQETPEQVIKEIRCARRLCNSEFTIKELRDKTYSLEQIK